MYLLEDSESIFSKCYQFFEERCCIGSMHGTAPGLVHCDIKNTLISPGKLVDNVFRLAMYQAVTVTGVKRNSK